MTAIPSWESPNSYNYRSIWTLRVLPKPKAEPVALLPAVAASLQPAHDCRFCLDTGSYDTGRRWQICGCASGDALIDALFEADCEAETDRAVNMVYALQ